MVNSWSTADRQYMTRALQLAWRGQYSTHPNPRVGCVIVNDGVVVGEGFHERAGEGHAEVHALVQAGARAKGATAYVTLEPCSHHGRTPPCADALINAGVSRVVAAMQDPNPKVSGKGLLRLKDAGIAVSSGLLEEQAVELNQGFISRMSLGRPFVRLKMASSLDGRTAMQSGESQWITGPDARRDVQRWRARASAILSSVGTIRYDNPMLTVREPELLDRRFEQPTRVILDSKAVLAGNEAVFEDTASVIYMVGNDCAVSEYVCSLAHVDILRMPLNKKGRFDAASLLERLAEREINEVLVEAGAGVAGDFLEQGAVDELLIYMAPKLMGSAARGLAELPFEKMSEALDLELMDLRMLGQDVRMQYRLARQ